MGFAKPQNPQQARLSPADGVSATDKAADPTFPSTTTFDGEGNDPRMVWRPGRAERAALAYHGAVRVRVEMAAVIGRIQDPCLYFDWGDGYSEETRKPLSLVARGIYSAVGHSNAGACRGIRFDPSSGPCRFRILTFTVEGVGAASNLPRLSIQRRLARRALRRLPARVQNVLRRMKATLNDRGAPMGRGVLRSLLGGGSDRWRAAYRHGSEVARNLRSPAFAAPPLTPPRRDPDGAKVVAFYLPQFHPIAENDAWWGKGFTEWTNVSKATPQFVDHLQPRLPAELGYYDLRVADVQRTQADLAVKAGVDAFCFHYYWFAGRRVLERPLDSFMNDPQITLPFALCWANENWTRRWDGQEQDVLLAQQHSAEDDKAVLADIARYMRSERYLRVGGKPVLIIYRPDILPEPEVTVERWRRAARQAGLGELFLLCTDAFGFSDYARYGFDGILQFPPHAISIGEITHRVQRLNPQYAGRVYDYESVVAAKEAELAQVEDGHRFPGVMPAWDNEARKPGAGHVFHGASPGLFHRWMVAALDASKRNAPPGERMVFVNAWNEWAEGAYLEPDRWFGHGFAQALRAALEQGAPRVVPHYPPIAMSGGAPKTRDAILLLHIYYSDLIESFAGQLSPLLAHADAAISFPDHWTPTEVDRLAQAFPDALLVPCPNRGRDVEPFLHLLAVAMAKSYTLFCKLHSKRSPHRSDGEQSRGQLFDRLAGAGAVEQALSRFAADPRLGLLATAESRKRLGEAGVMHNNGANLAYLSGILNLTVNDDTDFPAGTMFWGRTAAFEALTGPKTAVLPFEVEMARIDGTLAHALERAMAAVVAAAGYRVQYSL